VLLIDAYNVLHLPEAQLQGADLALEDLCAMIGASRYAGSRVVLVCDGSPPARLGAPHRAGGAARVRVAGVELVFSGPNRTADDEIEERLRTGRGAGVTLVSDDRRLTRAASRSRARSLGSSAFLAHLIVDRAGRRVPLPRFSKDIPLDAYSVEHWRREFGLPAVDPAAAVARAAGQGPAPAAPRPPETQREHPVRPHADHMKRKPAPQRDPAAREPTDAGLESLRADPLIREALEAWNGRLRLEDLDMRRWLGEPPGEAADRAR
jgi:hypothetical protein